MARLYQVSCPKCNNKTDFYRYGKDEQGHQKYQSKKCWRQFVPDTPAGKPGRARERPYLSRPMCKKAMYLHHDRERYAHYRCRDKKCGHAAFTPKPTAMQAPPMSQLFGKTDSKKMRYPVHVILMALSMFYLGKNSFRNIALILRTAMNVQVSHTTIGNWRARFAPCSKTLPYISFRR